MTSFKRSQYTLGTDLDANGNKIILGQENTPSSPTLQFGDGDSGFYEGLDDEIYISIGGSIKYKIIGGGMGAQSAAGARIIDVTTSATTPGYAFQGDSDTGLGRAGANLLSIIAGGAESIRVGTSTVDMKVDTTFTTKTPASAAATGTAGTIAWDADYIYVCTATDTWKRVAIATW